MRAFITGIGGQDGSYLAEYLLSLGYEVHGMLRRTSTNNRSNIANIKDKITLHYGNLSDSSSIFRLIGELKPDEVYNLAGQSHVKVSFDNPLEAVDVVAQGPVRILEAIRQLSPKTKFYQASSSEMFGDQKEPKNEDTPLQSRSPYSFSKILAHHAVRTYREAYNIFAVSGILFNHESPRRGEDFVTQKIVKQIKEVLEGKRDAVRLGNLDARRDWGFAGDYVKAMHLMLRQEKPEDFVIATGEHHSVREFIDEVTKVFGVDTYWTGNTLHRVIGSPLVVQDPALMRPADIELIVGDYSKAEKKLGWRPAVTFKELVRMMCQ